MNKRLISQSTYNVSKWSGGETTEVFLFPPEGQFRLNEFDYRVSTAKVAMAESTFSNLPGYKRIIMSLDNPLELHHKDDSNFRKEKLAPFQTDYFCGSDETKSFGRCTDFNLIYSPKYGGEMKTKLSEEVIKLQKNVVYVLYALQDIVLTSTKDNENIHVSKGDSLLIEDIQEIEQLTIDSSVKNSNPVLVEVSIR